MALLGILLLLFLEVVALGTAPARDRPLIGGSLIGAATAAFVTAGALLHHRRTAARSAQHSLPGIADGEWFGTEALEGFPMEAVRPLLLGPDAPSLNRLYTAWILATHGHDAAWISHHLDLPSATARLLADAARSRRPGTG